MSYKSPATEQQTALVVEDYADAREMMKIILEHMGYRVVEAAAMRPLCYDDELMKPIPRMPMFDSN